MSTHDKEKNATLKPDVLAALAEQAEAENKTVDDLLDEMARRYLETKSTISEMDSFVARNRKDALSKGIKESDVVRLVKESRRKPQPLSGPSHLRFQRVRRRPSVWRQGEARPSNGT